MTARGVGEASRDLSRSIFNRHILELPNIQVAVMPVLVSFSSTSITVQLAPQYSKATDAMPESWVYLT
jgi:hypothetical protein